ncbi:heparan sulfate glucosamine 3-o-sulfotransferase 5-like protein [Plakobranchus ocellatus]|uniref:Heparan sulfate glucosamine 3-o-sulfotransferase 5-like protein n=1 Tax=Plakobranchus ocellatus TaxID=259542 RepID=A0AAV4AX75_9GAST|nr:heparan sulfate glucosamine 3-o-sulfotransferase 5-like protein [Plakobranchus ocellatus]
MLKSNITKLCAIVIIMSQIGLLALHRSLKNCTSDIMTAQNLSLMEYRVTEHVRERSESLPTKKQRLPKALIIGFSKCGTSALRTFLTIHPYIVSPQAELFYFSRYFSRGLEWYRRQMPPSTPRQITIEKTPGYIKTKESLQRIYHFDPQIKLIVIARDPITRLQSQYAHVYSENGTINSSFDKWCKANGKRVRFFSHYAIYIRRLYNIFPRDQVLVLNEDTLEKDPLSVMRDAEAFLEIPPVFTPDMFVYDKRKGFFCFNTSTDLFPRVLKLVQVNHLTGCLNSDKGRKHPQINENILEYLKEVIKPLNEEFFALIGKRFHWDNFEDEYKDKERGEKKR